MESEGTPDPERPLREVFSEEQIEFLEENQDEYDLDDLLDQSLKDVMTSDDEPSVTDLMQAATDNDEGPTTPFA